MNVMNQCYFEINIRKIIIPILEIDYYLEQDNKKQLQKNLSLINNLFSSKIIRDQNLEVNIDTFYKINKYIPINQTNYSNT